MGMSVEKCFACMEKFIDFMGTHKKLFSLIRLNFLVFKMYFKNFAKHQRQSKILFILIACCQSSANDTLEKSMKKCLIFSHGETPFTTLPSQVFPREKNIK